jgi:hypothetical protein
MGGLRGQNPGMDSAWLSIPVQMIDVEGRATFDPSLQFPMNVVLWGIGVTEREANGLTSAGDYQRSQLLGPVHVRTDRRETTIELRARR